MSRSRSLRWSRAILPVLLVVLMPVLAACGAGANAAPPAAAPAVAAVATTAPAAVAAAAPQQAATVAPTIAAAPSVMPEPSATTEMPAPTTMAETTATAAPATTPAATAQGLNKINHVIVIYQENWSFDSLYGDFPGANGIDNAGAALKQVDKNGQPLTTVPQPKDTTKKPPVPDSRFPANLPVKPYELSQYVPPNAKIGDLPGGFYQEQAQIDGGKMDKFVSGSSNGGLTMGYYDATQMPEGRLAQQYTLADNFFHAAFGSSMLNHFWLIAGATPQWPNPSASIMAQVDASGKLVKDGVVTPDGYLVNTAYPKNAPHPSTITNTATLVPPLTGKTIGDELSSQSVSWAWFAGGWADALAGHPDPLFQFNHQPFAYYANYANGTPGQAAHLKDEKDFLSALHNGQLPAVSFVKPLGADNEHPGYASLLQGQLHVADLVRAVQNSPYWADSAIIIAYDENGGFWDHVAPPAGDRWGPGTRVPLIIISPYAKAGFIDHTPYDTTSILKLIETRWDLPALGPRDAAANGLTNALDFSQAPRLQTIGTPAPAK
jgi:phospholipase C